MTTTIEMWNGLHDATLESLELHWSSGKVVMHIRAGDARRPQLVIVADALRRLSCSREMPWGASRSINEVHPPAAIDGGLSSLEIEMQSGDRLRIEAGSFSLQDSE